MPPTTTGRGTPPRGRARTAAEPEPLIQGLEAAGLGKGLATPAGELARPPVFVLPSATVAQAARAIRDAGASAALVGGDPPGIVTDTDLRSRVLAAGRGPETPVADVMTRPLRTLAASTPLSGVLLLMVEQDIHHIALTREDEIVGVLSERDLLRRQLRSPAVLLARIRDAQPDDALDGYVVELASIADALFAEGLDALAVARVIASLNDALARRLLHVAETELGPPPCPYAWLVLGSQARMEQLLMSDQDNALVYAESSPEAERYFKVLAARVVDGLERAGFPLCPGGCTATNWRRPMEEWRRVFWSWIDTPEPEALLEAEEFLDYRPVYGEASIEPLEEILQAAGKRATFLVQLARPAVGFRPPLGLFGRLRSEDDRVDLKRGGIAAIMLLARLYALAAGSGARSTLERLDAAAEAGTLTHTGAETLAEAFRRLMRLRLRGQLHSLAAGRTPDNTVSLDDISPYERRRLIEAFREIVPIQRATELRFRTDVMS
jgi:CBS domain-containing protein